MNFHEELLKLLLDLKGKNQKLEVKWNAGGDETLLGFLIDENYVDSHQIPVFEKLRTIIVTKFQLPNAGEYYNHGKAEIKLAEDDTILITYDEFAYDSNQDIETTILEEEIKHSVTEASKNLLSALNQSSISFHGSIAFRNNEKENEFYFNYNYLEIKKNEDKVNLIQQHILKFVLNYYKGVTDSIELCFAGIIYQNEIIFNEFYVIKNSADKNHQNVTMPLFGE